MNRVVISKINYIFWLVAVANYRIKPVSQVQLTVIKDNI